MMETVFNIVLIILGVGLQKNLIILTQTFGNTEVSISLIYFQNLDLFTHIFFCTSHFLQSISSDKKIIGCQ